MNRYRKRPKNLGSPSIHIQNKKNILIEHCRILLHDLLELRIYLGPLWHEVEFISSAHSNEELKIAA
jgi:hypothetical protein